MLINNGAFAFDQSKVSVISVLPLSTGLSAQRHRWPLK
jgi:hypothetical protein